MKNDSTKFQLLKLSIKEFSYMLLCDVQYHVTVPIATHLQSAPSVRHTNKTHSPIQHSNQMTWTPRHCMHMAQAPGVQQLAPHPGKSLQERVTLDRINVSRTACSNPNEQHLALPLTTLALDRFHMSE